MQSPWISMSAVARTMHRVTSISYNHLQGQGEHRNNFAIRLPAGREMLRYPQIP